MIMGLFLIISFFCGDITYCQPCLDLNNLMDDYLGDLANILRDKY